jgi:hypothetical protein
MNTPAIINITLDSFSLAVILILIIILKHGTYQKNKLTNYFATMLFTMIVLLTSSILSWLFDNNTLPFSNMIVAISTFFFFLCWYIIKVYSSLYLYKYISSKINIQGLFNIAFYSIGIASVILLVISQFTGLKYSITEYNTIQRSDFFWLVFIGPVILYIIDFVMFFISFKKLSAKDLNILITFELLPMLALISLLFTNFILLNTAFTLSLLILYVRIQIMFTDELVALRLKTEKQTLIIMDGIGYANRIQRNLLPPDNVMASAFSDFSVLWQPRDVVGGDIYWIKQFDKGTVLCVCDCTGHSIPGALLAMLLVSVLESEVLPDNSDDPASVIFKVDERLAKVFNIKKMGRHETNDKGISEGCDIAILFISN